MNRIIFHIDVNSAFLSWTAVESLCKDTAALDIRTVPSIIGGDQSKRHGIVLAKSIPAKKYKIHTGEPISQALKKCPNLLIVPSDHALYEQYSHRLMSYLRTLTPDIEQVSIDECYMDFSGIAHRYESYLQAAAVIKDSIYEQFGFTVNVGISSNKLLAKMASDFEKPNKIHTLFPDEIQKKMWHLPVGTLFMAGHSSVATLKKLEINTIGDLAMSDPDMLALHLKSHGRLLWAYANGIDDSPVESDPYQLKGIGNSITLSSDVTDAAEAKSILLRLSEKVGQRLRDSNQCAYNVCVEIKYHDFVRVSHQLQLPSPLRTNDAIYQCSCQLFDTLWNHTPIRLLGIRTGKLVPIDAPAQLSLFDLVPVPTLSQEATPETEKQRKLDAALDSIRSKYGKDAIQRGNFFK